MRADKFYAHTFSRAVLMTLAFFVFAGMTQSVSALTLTVNQTGDAGDGACDSSCTLRDAIGIANGVAGADTIVFASPLFDTAQTINLTRAQLTISQSVTITGRGARLLTVRRSAAAGTPNFRIFEISSASAVVSISGMTISNGNEPDGSGSGGVRNSGGTLTLDGVTVSGNTTTAEGGGIGHAFGTTTILNSTVSGNTAGAFCGGIRVSNGTVNIANSTVSGNSAPGAGGGIVVFGTLNMNNVTVTNNSTTNGNAGNAGGVYRGGGTVNTRNSIIAGNFAVGGGRPDVGGAFVSNGNNLIGSIPPFESKFTQPGDKTDVPANLAPLANNGGQTDTHRPLPGSEAIDAGNNCVVNQSCGVNNPPVPLTTDQRGAGFPRQLGAAVDIGAFEGVLAPTAASVSVSGRVVTQSGRGIINVLVTMTDSNGYVRTTTTTSFGYYRFEEVAAGETYIFAARGKRFFFAQNAQVHSIMEETNDIDFVANGESIRQQLSTDHNRTNKSRDRQKLAADDNL